MSELTENITVPKRPQKGSKSRTGQTIYSHRSRLTAAITRLVPQNILSFTGMILAIYIFPFSIVALVPMPEPLKHGMAALSVTSVALYAIFKGYSWKELGFRSDNMRAALFWYGTVSLFLGVIIYVFYTQQWVREFNRASYGFYMVIFYLLISAPGQEFLYRSFLFANLERRGIRAPIVQILISALTFCYMHIQYRDILTLSFTFGIGVIWAVLYRKYPNFWLTSLSHAFLGYMAICTKLV